MTVGVLGAAADLRQHRLVVQGRSDRQPKKILLLCQRCDRSAVRHLLVTPKTHGAIPLGRCRSRLCALSTRLALIRIFYNINQSHGCSIEDEDRCTTETMETKDTTLTGRVEIDELFLVLKGC